MTARPSLRGRIALAIGLLIGFYVIALGIAVGLVYLPYAGWEWTGHANARLTIFCLVGALAIVKGIVPRRDRFEPPGPELKAAKHPRLFAAIDEVARATGQAMPREVYLVPDVNAYVMERGGVMGFGSRRVMGIGLPLLESLTVAEFRAVIAHEFGHYHGGDTKLGPWVYKTRAAIVRTLVSVGAHSSWLQKPFEWYGVAFSRVTLAVSRRQEFVADELSAGVCGASHLASALTALERAGMAYGAYWQTEVAHVLERGFRPPLIDGFAQFVSAPAVEKRLDEVVAEQIADGSAGPYDTHPSLKQRLDALAALPRERAASSDQVASAKAVTLLEDINMVEASLVASLLKPGAPALSPIAWEDVPGRVLSAAWADLVRPSLPGLAGLRPSVFPEVAKRLDSDPDALARQLGVQQRAGADHEEVRAHAAGILGAALALVLKRRMDEQPGSISLFAPPGHSVEFRIARAQMDDAEACIRPFETLARLRDTGLSASEWIAVCEKAGITHEDLSVSLESRSMS